MKDGLIISILSIIPKNAVTRIMGRSARIRLPRVLHRLLIRWFIWKYKVNLDECEQNLDSFNSLSDFFLRQLKPGVRNILTSDDTWASPVDGTVHAFGKIENGTFYQSNSQTGKVNHLLGANHSFASDLPSLSGSTYENGAFAILYLSPKDYHRVHLPFSSTIKWIRYIPGQLWPVFPAATRGIQSLFESNERLVFSLQTKTGTAALIMVGAFGVGRMSTSLVDFKTNTKRPGQELILDPAKEQAVGEELGCFELGSTVILLWENQPVDWKIQQGNPIRLGEAIASFHQT